MDPTAGRNIGDVLVVGGGISGIQAALDLANSGFRVYLVDKSPALGGKMSQLAGGSVFGWRLWHVCGPRSRVQPACGPF